MSILAVSQRLSLNTANQTFEYFRILCDQPKPLSKFGQNDIAYVCDLDITPNRLYQLLRGDLHRPLKMIYVMCTLPDDFKLFYRNVQTF